MWTLLPSQTPNTVGSAPGGLTLLQKLLFALILTAALQAVERASNMSLKHCPLVILTTGSVFEAQYSVCAAGRGDHPAYISAEKQTSPAPNNSLSHFWPTHSKQIPSFRVVTGIFSLFVVDAEAPCWWGNQWSGAAVLGSVWPRGNISKFTASNTSADKNQLPNLKPKHQTVTRIRSACCFEFDLAPLSSSKHQCVKAYRSGFMILKDIRAVWDMQSKCLKITLGQERKIPGRAATFISTVVGNWKTQCLFLKSKLMRSWVACN